MDRAMEPITPPWHRSLPMEHPSPSRSLLLGPNTLRDPNSGNSSKSISKPSSCWLSKAGLEPGLALRAQLSRDYSNPSNPPGRIWAQARLGALQVLPGRGAAGPGTLGGTGPPQPGWPFWGGD